MSSSLWQKRCRKFQRFFKTILSGLTLRYTDSNCVRLQRQIKQKGIHRFHVGCGNVLLRDWLNITYDASEIYGVLLNRRDGLLLSYDLRKRWPVEDGSLDFVAGSHFIEHLDLNHGIQFAREAYRCLKKGGVVRLSCPDLEIYAKNYVERNKRFFDHPKVREWCAFKQADTPGEILAAKAYDSGGSHQWFYDFESLKHVLQLAGFSVVKRCGRLEGKTPDLERLEPAERELETVYIEAEKV